MRARNNWSHEQCDAVAERTIAYLMARPQVKLEIAVYDVQKDVLPPDKWKTFSGETSVHPRIRDAVDRHFRPRPPAPPAVPAPFDLEAAFLRLERLIQSDSPLAPAIRQVGSNVNDIQRSLVGMDNNWAERFFKLETRLSSLEDLVCEVLPRVTTAAPAEPAAPGGDASEGKSKETGLDAPPPPPKAVRPRVIVTGPLPGQASRIEDKLGKAFNLEFIKDWAPTLKAKCAYAALVVMVSEFTDSSMTDAVKSSGVEYKRVGKIKDVVPAILDYAAQHNIEVK